MIFHSRRGHLRTQIASKLLAVGASSQTHWGAYSVPAGPLAGGEGACCPLPQTPSPLSAIRASSFGPKSQLRAPNLLLNQGHPEPCYVTVRKYPEHAIWSNAMITITIRLRYDYNTTTTYRARLLPFDANKKSTCQFFVVVVS